MTDDDSCASDPIGYTRLASGLSTDYSGLRIVGIAKDGHVIYGPYDDNDELWDCDDHDICNGRYFAEMDGSYTYVMTVQHPYVIGCWGPGPSQIHQQYCSQNTCGAINSLMATQAALFLSVLTVILIF